MLAVYQKLESEGKIGKFFRDETGIMRARQFAEFPKTVRLPDPADPAKMREIIVNSAREELAVLSREGGAETTDPVVNERNQLLEMVAEARSANEAIVADNEALKREMEELRRMLVNKSSPPEPLPSAAAKVSPVLTKKG